MSVAPRPSAMRDYKLHSHLLQVQESAIPQTSPRQLCFSDEKPSSPHSRRGWRPVSGKREATGDSVPAVPGQAGLFRGEKVLPSPLALELQVRRPMSASGNAVRRRDYSTSRPRPTSAAARAPSPPALTTEQTGSNISSPTDSRLSRVVAEACARLSVLLWATDTVPTSPAFQRAYTLWEIAIKRYEVRLLGALHSCAAALHAAVAGCGKL